jgi:hypothetical protein
VHLQQMLFRFLLLHTFEATSIRALAVVEAAPVTETVASAVAVSVANVCNTNEC